MTHIHAYTPSLSLTSRNISLGSSACATGLLNLQHGEAHVVTKPLCGLPIELRLDPIRPDAPYAPLVKQLGLPALRQA